MFGSLFSFFKKENNKDKVVQKPVEMQKPVEAQNSPIPVELKKGETYYYCTCRKSDNQPFCDGSHEGTDFKPMAFKAEKDGTAYLCACKQTKNPPYCDGSHKNL